MDFKELRSIIDDKSPKNEKLLAELNELQVILERDSNQSETNDQVPKEDIVKLFKLGDFKGVIKLYNSPNGNSYNENWDLYIDSLEIAGFLNVAIETLSKTLAYDSFQENFPAMTEKLENLRIRLLYLPLITNLSIDIRETDTKGKGIFAKKAIKSGNVIFFDLPVVCAPNLDNAATETFCSLCSKSILTCEFHFKSCWDSMTEPEKTIIQANWPPTTKIPCDHCTFEYYCSETCKTLAWDKYHQYICPSKNPAASALYELCSQTYQSLDKQQWNAMFSPMLIVKLLVSKLSPTGNSMRRVYQNVKEDLITFAAPRSQKIEPFLTRIHKLITSILEPWIIPEDPAPLESFLEVYYKCATNVQSFNSPLYNTAAYQIFETAMYKWPREYGQLAKYIIIADEGLKDQTFCGLFLLHACLNHDCRPNASVEDFKDNAYNKIGVTVRAIKDIAIGEEITISYIDTTMPKWVRQAWLIRAYAFKCQCLACKFEGSNKSICSNCGKKTDDTESAEALKTCGRCFRAWYCSKPCQIEHWNAGHKTICDKKKNDSLTNVVLKNANIKLAF